MAGCLNPFALMSLLGPDEQPLILPTMSLYNQEGHLSVLLTFPAIMNGGLTPIATDFVVNRNGSPIGVMATIWHSPNVFQILTSALWAAAYYDITYTKGVVPFKVLASDREYDSFGPLTYP